MSITHTTGRHHKANAHHSLLDPSTMLMANHPHNWAPSPDSSVLSSTQPSPTITVLEPTATPMPIAISLGPITTPYFINIHTDTEPHHCALHHHPHLQHDLSPLTIHQLILRVTSGRRLHV
ncbi:hypothetical protein Pmani_033562 [Petrolisthes manimaculis]|uniref:Uncharacterized protein n=1 Tax=Petrolisthes manimaculis TaxID=1843537 RepID=A0AAE1TQ99_9EUCA|nr:hypothetical protein Pmani_033562 [Petrolisthes manimaculis]